MQLKKGCRVRTASQLSWTCGSSDPEEQEKMRNRRRNTEGEVLGSEPNSTVHVRHDDGTEAVYQPEELNPV